MDDIIGTLYSVFVISHLVAYKAYMLDMLKQSRKNHSELAAPREWGEGNQPLHKIDSRGREMLV